ncbi:MAG TPA: HPr family phosphocarrier protein [Acidobacteriota bacterium]|nr:HPr family phosphocarrier protein [Acidobacteriota bacterium]
MIREVVRIENQLGLHARAAARLVKLTARYQSDIKLSRLDGRQRIDAKSILGILLLAAARGTELEITVEGPDETDALAAVVGFVNDRFGEEK